jgi:hypothetical protein
MPITEHWKTGRVINYFELFFELGILERHPIREVCTRIPYFHLTYVHTYPYVCLLYGTEFLPQDSWLLIVWYVFTTRFARFFLVQQTKMGKSIPKWTQKYQMAIKYVYQNDNKNTKWPWNTRKFSIPRPSTMYQNWHFWHDNIPSGNPVYDSLCVNSLILCQVMIKQTQRKGHVDM